MKKKYKIILAAIAVVWLFSAALQANRYLSAKQPSAAAETTASALAAAANATETTSADKKSKQDAETAETTTAAAASTVPATEKGKAGDADENSTAVTETTTEATTVKEYKNRPATWSEKTVIKKMRAAINQIESATESVKISETKAVELNIVKCSQDSLLTALNNIVKGFVGEKEMIYNFEDGIATDSSGVTVTADDVLLPANGSFKLNADNVVYTAAEKSGQNVMLTVKIGSETVDYNTVPVNHAAGIGYIDFSKLNFSPASITGAQVLYKRATVKAVINSKGELVSLYGSLPFKVTASGRLGKTVEVDVSGKITWSWKIG